VATAPPLPPEASAGATVTHADIVNMKMFFSIFESLLIEFPFLKN
jgi:hypothetical protein